MTISYTAEVATCRGFGCFLKLLLRWRGSIYKMIWMDLIVFLFLYYALSYVYRLALNAPQKEMFEHIARYCNNYGSLIPLSFVLGFYVAMAMKRWWDQYMNIPWPDPIAVFVSSLVHGQDVRGRVMRRTIMRYVCLCLTMVLANISPRVKKRFPTYSHLVDAGLLQENENLVIQNLDRRFPKHTKHWMPIVWAASIVKRARKEGRIRDDFAVKTIIDELNKFRGSCGLLVQYDVISIPLVYTQVVTLAVYSYFLCSIMGKQWIERPAKEGYFNMVDSYFPVFTTLEFFFYMGWLKVAESLINPFGDDDDDFEINWLIDRNLQVSYLIVDEMHHEHPELIKDQYWDEVFPNELPYNDGSTKREEPPEPSTAKLGQTKTILSSMKLDCTSQNGSVLTVPSRNCSLQICSQMSMCRVNSALTNPLQRLVSDTTDVPSVAKHDSFLNTKDANRVPSTLIAVVKPSRKELDLKPNADNSSAANDRRNGEDFGEIESQSSLETRQIFSHSSSEIGRFYTSTSGESLQSTSSPGNSAHGRPKDDFDRLREQREKKRLKRQIDNIARVGNAANVTSISSNTQIASPVERQAATPTAAPAQRNDDTREKEETPQDEEPPKN